MVYYLKLIIDIFVFKERNIRTSYFVLGIGAKLQLRCKFSSFEIVSKLLFFLFF